MSGYLKRARELEDQLVSWRRDFHKHPELRFEEVRTAGIVASHLSNLGYEVRSNIGSTGVVGIMEGNCEAPTVLLRFDMDALPLQEENECEYCSTVPGKMHACGHDGHVAIGMGVATLLSENIHQLNGTVMLVFQPAEEGAKGARAMIDDGVFDIRVPDYCFGLHLHSQTLAGKVFVGDGASLASADSFKISVVGKGGHGAQPHSTIDAVVVGAQIVNNLQTVVSRNVAPMDTAVVSVGSFHAGTAFNIIAETAEICGSIRTYDAGIQNLIHRRIREIANGSAELMGASAEVVIEKIVPALINDPEIAKKFREVAGKLIGDANVGIATRAMPSDDMALFLQKAPGCYFSLGAGGEEFYPHHNPRFDWDESVMPIGVALLCEIATEYLKGSND